MYNLIKKKLFLLKKLNFFQKTDALVAFPSDLEIDANTTSEFRIWFVDNSQYGKSSDSNARWITSN